MSLARWNQKAVWSIAALAMMFAGALSTRFALSQTSPGDDAGLIARGKSLALAADCMPCHTGPGRAPFTGGLVLNTPFGGLASPNITPDKATGIGNWTGEQFWNAVHNGIAPGRSWLVFPNYLYPGMPFTSYSKLSHDDVMAIFAYLRSLPPVAAPPVPSTLGFPFNQRPVLLGWRLLFFRAGPMRMDPGWSQNLKNGAYLTEALGHCGECHTPRNALSGLIADRSLAGAPVDAYYAPNISSDKADGIGGWSADDLVAYLHDDGNMTRGSAFGPMQEVVQQSLSQLPKSDVADIALYLQTATPPRRNPPAAAVATDLAHGAQVYAANCAACHGKDGKGRAVIIPPLAGNGSVTAAAPYNVIGAVLEGVSSWHGGPPMPAFAASLSDADIAALANYVRTAWGNRAAANATAGDVKAARALAKVPMIANAASDEFGCPHVSAAGGAALADPGNGLLNIMAGATPETLPNRTRALIAALRAGDSSISPVDLTNDLIAAYCPLIANQPGLTMAQRRSALANFLAGAQRLVTPETE